MGRQFESRRRDCHWGSVGCGTSRRFRCWLLFSILGFQPLSLSSSTLAFLYCRGLALFALTVELNLDVLTLLPHSNALTIGFLDRLERGKLANAIFFVIASVFDPANAQVSTSGIVDLRNKIVDGAKMLEMTTDVGSRR